jgi:archaellum component FlaC
MSNSEETTEPDFKIILEAIKDLDESLNNRIDNLDLSLNNRIDNIENKLNSHDVQFESVRQGLVTNSAAFDRLESVVYSIRSDMSGLKADVKELTEQVYQANKSGTKETLELK